MPNPSDQRAPATPPKSFVLISQPKISIGIMLIAAMAAGTTLADLMSRTGSLWVTLVKVFVPTVVVTTGILLENLLKIHRVEILPDRIRLFSRIRFLTLPLAEIDSIANLPRPFSAVDRQWVIKPKRGPKLVLKTERFTETLELEHALKDLALTVLARKVSVNPREITTSHLFPTILFTIAAITGVYCFFFDPARFNVVSFIFAVILPLSIAQVVTILQPKIRLGPHGINGPNPIPYDQITEVNINTYGATEFFTVNSYKGSITVDEKRFGANYPLVRDLLLLRATKARVTGQTNPDHLRLCTLPGPLDQLHSKPIDPATTDQHEESVHA